MLYHYMERVQRYLRDQRVQIVAPYDLIDHINEARAQLAGDSECILSIGTLPIVAGTRSYAFSSIAQPSSATSGIAGVLNVRTLWYNVGLGEKWMRPRPWPWFSLYELNNPVPTQGPPKVWAQYGQGVAGSIYLSPLPDFAYTVNADCVCYPVALVDDTTVEAIPNPWTDAVPFYATYVAMMAMQTGGPTEESEKMFRKYKEYVVRARAQATSSIAPTVYPQVPNPVRANQIGVQAKAD
jgi:hypothetical protein